MKVLDVSNFVSTDLSGLIAQEQPEAVIVRVKLRAEKKIATGIDHAQIASAQAHGLPVGLYVWCYASLDPGETVQQAASLAAVSGISLDGKHPATGVLWLDCEDPNDPPDAGWMRAALRWAGTLGVVAGIYTSRGWWNAHITTGAADLANAPLWLASYDGVPDLNVGVPPYTWTSFVGKQYAENPDLSVFVDPLSQGEGTGEGTVNDADKAELLRIAGIVQAWGDLAAEQAGAAGSHGVQDPLHTQEAQELRDSADGLRKLAG